MSEKRILIAEDDPIIAMDLAQTLKSWNYNVKVISSGEEVVIAAYAIKPDLIIMDIGLHGMDGIEAAQQIQKLSIPIIYITGRDLTNESNQHVHVKKPFDTDVLQNEIQSALKGIKNPSK
jgi:DNA-binding response OmpR family regulator